MNPSDVSIAAWMEEPPSVLTHSTSSSNPARTETAFRTRVVAARQSRVGAGRKLRSTMCSPRGLNTCTMPSSTTTIESPCATIALVRRNSPGPLPSRPKLSTGSPSGLMRWTWCARPSRTNQNPSCAAASATENTSGNSRATSGGLAGSDVRAEGSDSAGKPKPSGSASEQPDATTPARSNVVPAVMISAQRLARRLKVLLTILSMSCGSTPELEETYLSRNPLCMRRHPEHAEPRNAPAPRSRHPPRTRQDRHPLTRCTARESPRDRTDGRSHIRPRTGDLPDPQDAEPRPAPRPACKERSRRRRQRTRPQQLHRRWVIHGPKPQTPYRPKAPDFR